jgi:hypothetical protein
MKSAEFYNSGMESVSRPIRRIKVSFQPKPENRWTLWRMIDFTREALIVFREVRFV